MVFINRSAPAPDVLRLDGVNKRDEHIRDYEAEKDLFKDNSKNGLRFKFDPNIYGDSSVKGNLERIQNYKCCFCESKYKHVSAGDIEHFRPKAAFKQGKNHPLTRPGYFWLAYEWHNLLLSCEVCNRRNKKNFFPLKNLIRRCEKLEDDIDKEEPYFIDPSKIDPELHITFHQETPEHKTFEGAQTIKFLELNREELNEIRRSKLDLLLSLEKAYIITKDTIWENELKENFFNHLREIIHNNGEFHLMVKTNFNKYIQHL